MNTLLQVQLQQRQAAVAEYKRRHMTPAVREAMTFWHMSEEEYDRRLMASLFPYPITYTVSDTNQE